MTQKNVYGTPLQSCSIQPKTGFFRDGFCQCSAQDVGQHTICCLVTDAFLSFSRRAGNDLSTPRPEYQFPGLVAGDQWCVCLSRWIEANDAGCAPQVILEATHESVLDYVSLEQLKEHEL